MLVNGYTCLNVAANLGVSETTIRTYVRRLYRKLQVADRVALGQALSACGWRAHETG